MAGEQYAVSRVPIVYLIYSTTKALGLQSVKQTGMKKQPAIRSKAGELQQRLITREAYQLVNSKKFSTATSRNERQFQKELQCLHKQQAKSLAKIQDEIHEVRIHRKMLKEVDESARDPRTPAEKMAEIIEDNKINSGQDVDGIELGRLNLRTSGVEKQVVILRNHPPGGERHRSLTLPQCKNDRPRSLPSLGSLFTNDQKLGGGNKIPVVTEGPKLVFLAGVDMKVKRDTDVVRRYNYNLKSLDKSFADRNRYSMPEIAQKVKASQVTGNERVNSPKLNGYNGKKNRRTTGVDESRLGGDITTKPSGGEETIRIGHRTYVPVVPALEIINADGRRRVIRCRRKRNPESEKTQETGTENEQSSS